LCSNKSLKLTFLFATIVFAVNAFSAQIEGVPFVKQDPEKCGPASLASVLSYYGVSIHPDAISESTYHPKLKGSLITDLENFGRRIGFITESGQGDMERLKKFIDNQKPVIALVDLGIWIVAKPHYLVLFGYNDEGFIMHDGENPSQICPYAVFYRTWEKMGRVYLLVYR
jgi:ABC-type bacteriocin/lantibiotic exporter with double-glycine peptidase domain